MPVQEPHFFESIRQYLAEYFGAQDQVKLNQLYKSVIAEMMKDPRVSEREAYERLCNYVMGLAAKGFRKRHPLPKPTDDPDNISNTRANASSSKALDGQER
jgi:hypothetical protein